MKLPEPPPASSPAVRAVMQGNRARDTRPEQAARSALHRLGLRFRKHAQPLKGLRCQADAVFPREKVAVFVDGCFWHGCPEHGRVPSDKNGYWAAKLGRNMERDQRNNKALGDAGWLVLRYWEHEDPTQIALDVQAAVSRRRAQAATSSSSGSASGSSA
jgi:DNA mismatch endonuclease (patch repair protein)